jgi:hypothetical protein
MGERAMAVLMPSIVGRQGMSLNRLRVFTRFVDDDSGCSAGCTHYGESRAVLTPPIRRRRPLLAYVDRKESER